MKENRMQERKTADELTQEINAVLGNVFVEHGALGLTVSTIIQQAMQQAAQEAVEAYEEALTPSAETKAAYIGEFGFSQTVEDDDGEWSMKITVPWTVTKDIMEAIRQRAKQYMTEREGE